MNQLTNQEKAKVFAMYWGQECVMVTAHGDHKPFRVDGTLLTLVASGQITYLLDLKPLSNIEDADAVKLYHLYSGSIGYDCTMDFGGVQVSAIGWAKREGIGPINRLACLTDYARSVGYDTKIYFTANHWANGKTAIELGIAIDKNENGGV